MKRQVNPGRKVFILPLVLWGKSCKIIPDKEKRYTNEEIQKKLSENFKQVFKGIEGKRYSNTGK